MSAVILGVSPRGAWHVWQRNFTVYRKTYKLNILPNFFEPVIYLVAMGFGLGAYITRTIEGFEYLPYIAPGLIAASAMNASDLAAAVMASASLALTASGVPLGTERPRNRSSTAS